MKVALSKSELGIFAVAILKKYPSLTNQAFKKKLGITLGREFFSRNASGTQNTAGTGMPAKEFFDKVAKLDSLNAVAEFCLHELGDREAFNKLVGSSYSAYINTVVPNNRFGCTPFHGSVINKDLAMFDLYLPFADVNKPNILGDTPLILACITHSAQNDNSYIIDALLKKPGINLNVQGQSGYTALHIAMRNGNYPLFEKLMRAGIDPTLICKEGFTALELGIFGSSKSDAVVPCLEQVREKLNLRIRRSDGMIKDRYPLLFNLIVNKHFAAARLAIAFGANVNEECKAGTLSTCCFSLYFIKHFRQNLAFTQEDIPALEFFRDSAYDFNQHKSIFSEGQKRVTLRNAIIPYLVSKNRINDLLFIAKYLGPKLGIPAASSHIKIRELSDGRLLIFICDEYFPADNREQTFSRAFDELEASYTILKDKLDEVKPEASTVEEPINKQDESDEALQRQRQLKIIEIKERIDEVEVALEGTHKHMPNWIKQFSSTIEHHSLSTLDQFLEKVSDWSSSTLNKIAFDKDITPDSIVKQTVIPLPALATASTAVYEHQFTLNMLSPVEISGAENLKFLPPKNLGLIKDMDTLNPDDRKKIEALAQNPRLAAQKGMPGVKLLKGNASSYRFFGANQTAEQRDIVAEMKISHSPARVLCCKLQKEGKGPEILVPVVALNKGLHKAKEKSRAEYHGSGLFLTPATQPLDEQPSLLVKK